MKYVCCDNTTFIHNLLNRLGTRPVQKEESSSSDLSESSAFLHDDGSGSEF